MEGYRADEGQNQGLRPASLTRRGFGFSRGAAAARHFIARRHSSQGRANNLCGLLGVDPAVVTIKFAGLFDTVSSFDETGDEPGDAGWKAKAKARALHGDQGFLNDVGELHLTIDDEQVEKVVQLAAADEYRVNFFLTNISSARQRGRGCEFLLPGAHSDIGGGYAQVVTEELVYSTTLDTARALPFFQEKGWYGPGQTEDKSYTSRTGGKEVLVVGKREVPNTYQYVALSIMLKLAGQSGMQFESPNSSEQRGIKYIISPTSPLFGIKNQLEGFVLAHAGPQPAALVVPLPLAELRWLRQHYLHLSWKTYKLGFEFRRDKNHLPTRLQLLG